MDAPAQSATSLRGFDLRVVACSCCILLGGPDSTEVASPVSAGSTTGYSPLPGLQFEFIYISTRQQERQPERRLASVTMNGNQVQQTFDGIIIIAQRLEVLARDCRKGSTEIGGAFRAKGSCTPNRLLGFEFLVSC
jgi:hypothetical protein